MILRTVILVAALSAAAGCASTEERDAFQDTKTEFNRAAIACGSNTDCLQNVKQARKAAKKEAKSKEP